MDARSTRPGLQDMAQGESRDDQRRRIRRTTVLLTLVALAIYVGFIVSSMMQASS